MEVPVYLVCCMFPGFEALVECAWEPELCLCLSHLHPQVGLVVVAQEWGLELGWIVVLQG